MTSDRTPQIDKWTTNFGRKYTDRNPQTVEELDTLYVDNFGITRTRLNKEFIGFLDRSIKILEVGCNIGAQLLCLREMGFKNLFGIELQNYAVKKAQTKLTGAQFIQGSALNLPFENNSFDLIFTSGVLIHISPNNINQAVSEIIRCTKKYIWGYEYYSKKYEMIRYRGKDNLLWRANYSKIFLGTDLKLELILKRDLKHIGSNNFDRMYILKIDN